VEEVANNFSTADIGCNAQCSSGGLSTGSSSSKNIFPSVNRRHPKPDRLVLATLALLIFVKSDAMIRTKDGNFREISKLA
jgi:hypothetical protein